MKWGERPTLIMGTNFCDQWTSIDRLLALGYTLASKTFCGGCGHSLIRTTDKDAIGHLEVDELFCEACLKLEQYQNEDQNHSRARIPRVIDTGDF